MSGKHKTPAESDNTDKLSGLQAEKDDPLALARQEIEEHKKLDASRSYLGRAVSAISRGDETSLSKLEELSTAYQDAVKTGDTAAEAVARKAIAEQIEADRKALASQDDYVHYGTGFVKAATLFMRGKAGLAGAAAAYALDQMNPGDSLSTQGIDGGLGLAKGLALRGIFSRLGQAEVGIAAKGIGLGVSSRLIETGLNRQTYTDAQGKFSFGQGVDLLRRGALSKEALATDVVVFGLAHGITRAGSSITGGALERSPLASTMLTAGSFGLAGGSTAEVMRQLHEGRSFTTFDYGQIARKGATQGAIDLLAGAPGGLQARAALTPSVESIRQAGEKRSVARQLAADTQPFEIGHGRESLEFFTRLGRALGPGQGAQHRASLFQFLESSPSTHAGVKRFAEAHPDAGVKSVLSDFFQGPAGRGGAPETLTLADIASKGAPKARDTRALADITGSGSRTDRPAVQDGPGVFSTSRKGEMWEPERDITKLTSEQRWEMMREVKSPLFEFEPLDALGKRILAVTEGWKDLTPQVKAVEEHFSDYKARVEAYQKLVVNPGHVPKEFIHGQTPFHRQSAYEWLESKPELRRIAENYFEARDRHGLEEAKLEEAVHFRAVQLEEAVNKFAKEMGLPGIRIKLNDYILASARYTVGHGEIELKKLDLHDTRDTSSLVRKVTHELTHSEQDYLMVRRVGDLVGVGERPTEAQIWQMQKLYQERTGSFVDLKYIVKCMRHRQGTRLTPDQAARADVLFDAFKHNKTPGQDFIEAGNHYRIAERELDQLEREVQGPNGPALLLARLGGGEGSSALSKHLFGTGEPPANMKALAQHARALIKGEDVVWPRPQIDALLKRTLRARMEELNAERRGIYASYMAGLHEREAWVVAERGRTIAEGNGATRIDAERKLSPDEQWLQDLLDQRIQYVIE